MCTQFQKEKLKYMNETLCSFLYNKRKIYYTELSKCYASNIPILIYSGLVKQYVFNTKAIEMPLNK